MSYLYKRKDTRVIKLGNLSIGADHPITVQSMTTTSTEDYQATIDQIKELESVGCDIVRISVPNMKCAQVIHKIKEQTKCPLVADIHFDYRLALESIQQGIDGLRLNPGNIKKRDKVEMVVNAAKQRQIPIRIGVNSGSINREKYGKPTPENLVESAMEHIRILEELNYHHIKISLKCTDVPMTIASYQLMSAQRSYPLHLGITEAGTLKTGTIKSSVGIGSLLSMGIGDTLRVSLAADPKQEVRVGKQILQSLNLLNEDHVQIIACPTCGRCDIDVMGISEQLEDKLGHINKNIRIAIMGCIVNGPGESINADIGISGGKGLAMLYIKGKLIERIPESQIVQRVIETVNHFPSSDNNS